MIVLCVTNCPPALRGDLSKWLSEVNTGIYVGKLSARVREELWERVCSHIKAGQATMVYSSNTEQGYVFLTHNTTWTPIDFEGITLMQRPVHKEEMEGNAEEVSFLQPGFSKAAKYEKARYFEKRKPTKLEPSYIILDVETTGLDYQKDRIIEIAMLKVRGTTIEQQFQCLVQPETELPKEISKLTGLTMELLEKEGLTESEAFDKVKEFIDTDLVIGYQIQFDLTFLQKLGKRVGKNISIKKAKDVLSLARRELEDLTNYKLETVARHFSLDTTSTHRALADCLLTYRVYCELNKI